MLHCFENHACLFLLACLTLNDKLGLPYFGISSVNRQYQESVMIGLVISKA